MKILGVIAEYNPFHKGHLYHIEKSKEITGADAVIVAMSGNFVQRGEPAIADKWVRAEMAVRNGADIVFELPFAYAVNSADCFARGGIRLLNGLGCVDFISFGSEEGDFSNLETAANALRNENEFFKSELRKCLDAGYSYPKARAEALTKTTGIDGDILKKSNNILAIEYLRYLKEYGSDITPVTVKRIGQDYNETCDNPSQSRSDDFFLSATAIREYLYKNIDISSINGALTDETISVIKDINNDIKLKINDFYNLIAYEILKNELPELSEILAVTEGMENRLKVAVRKSNDIDSLIEAVVSKRYTSTRIKRMLIQLLVGLKRDAFKEIDETGAMYGRILAFSSKGASVIKSIKRSDKCSVPIITNINKEPLSGAEKRLLEYDIISSDIYNLALGRNIYDYSDFVIKPYSNISI